MNFEPATEEKEYAKDKEIKEYDIQALLKWVREDSRLPDVSEFMLIQCYQVSDYNFEACRRLVETLYSLKNKAPELFTGFDKDSSKYTLKFFDTQYMFVLPKSTPEGYRIIYIGLKNLDPQHFDSNVYISMSIKTLFTIIIEQGSCPGYIVISDNFGFKFAHLRKINFTAMKQLLNFVSTAIPIKMKVIHIIQASRIAYYGLTLLRPFMSKAINESIHMFSEMNKFFDVVPREYIPKDLGGTLPFTKDECNEIQRRKVDFFSNQVDQELQKRTIDFAEDDSSTSEIE